MDVPRFLADKTVGRLARWLRLLGYDCRIDRESDPDRLLAHALEEDRVLLTKNRRMGDAATVCQLSSSDTMVQLRQVVQRFALAIESDRMLTVCSVCDAKVETLTRDQVRGLVPPYVFATQKTFSRCLQCGRIYWAGTHKERMLNRLHQAGLM